MKIGIMGAEGSFSEEAARKYIETERVSDAELVFLVSAERVLTALEDGSIDTGIFPIENSNGGIVIEAVHAMAKHRFQVEKMFEIDVHQNLLVVPGTNPEQITAITSHDQALKQCRMYLKRKWPGVDLSEYEDTAKAAADLRAGVLPPTTAVIASRRAAELYELDILEASIQDLKFNYTSFVVAKALV
ncbi:MAG: prephenate dehydratase domain-containing protein [Patescibacteria group bacterium]